MSGTMFETKNGAAPPGRRRSSMAFCALFQNLALLHTARADGSAVVLCYEVGGAVAARPILRRP